MTGWPMPGDAWVADVRVADILLPDVRVAEVLMADVPVAYILVTDDLMDDVRVADVLSVTSSLSLCIQQAPLVQEFSCGFVSI